MREVGDGQVSDLPEGADSDALFEALVTAGAGGPLTLTAGPVTLRALLPSRAARVADGDAAGFTWIDGAPPQATSGGAGIVVRAVAAGLHHPGWGVFVRTHPRASTPEAALGVDDLAGDPPGLVGREPGNEPSRIVRRTDRPPGKVRTALSRRGAPAAIGFRALPAGNPRCAGPTARR